jgi:hypothetical protein
MKKIFFIVFTGCLFSLSACDSGFEELNKDPNAVTADRFNPAYLLRPDSIIRRREMKRTP